MKREDCSLSEKIQQFQEESSTTVKNEQREKKIREDKKASRHEILIRSYICVLL